MNTLIIIILGIIMGWIIPRPRFIGKIEEALIGDIKKKVPDKFRWW